MNRVSLYISNTKVDLFPDESIEITMSVKNVTDISKVFGDFSKGFTIPASPTNNKVFKHYYNVDVSGGFNANTHTSAFIEINNNLFKTGVIELEEVQMKNMQPHSYSLTFYSKTTALKDLFGEDKLNDLDLSAYDHDYTNTNVYAGFTGYVSGTGDNVIYPLITPYANWFYDSSGSVHTPENISYHSGHPEHGVFYYDLKPALRLSKIVDAIEAKYSVTFNSDFFGTTDFTRLFMWCHREEGYLYKDKGGTQNRIIDYDTESGSGTDLDNNKFTLPSTYANFNILIDVQAASATKYEIVVLRNSEVYAHFKTQTGNTTNLQVDMQDSVTGDEIQVAFRGRDGAEATILEVDTAFRNGTSNIGFMRMEPTTFNSNPSVDMANEMPEQKIADFMSSLFKMFNLVVVPTGETTYDIEPLDNWYAEGTTRDITEFVKVDDVAIKRTPLYQRISYKYAETEAILGEEFRLRNSIGYGDLEADFTFDGEEFEVEVGFDHMLFERLVDQDTEQTTQVNVGRSLTRDLEGYIGEPFVFYAPGRPAYSDGSSISFVDMGLATHQQTTQVWLATNCNAAVAANVTKTINFGAEVDPFFLETFTSGLYSSFWQDYITDLYDTSRRLFTFSAILPLRVMLDLKVNDKLTIHERDYLINSVSININTGETTLELLNNV